MTPTRHRDVRTLAEARGLTRLSDGVLGRDLGEVPAPRVPGLVELSGDDLVYGFEVDKELETQLSNALRRHDADAFRRLFDGAAPAVSSTNRALDSFLQLSDASSILRFAKSWGPLLLCEHGVPAPHGADLVANEGWPTFALASRSARCVAAGRESIDDWLAYAAAAADLVRLAADYSEMSATEKLMAERFASDLLSYWLAVADVRPTLRWSSGESSFGLSGEGVWPVLVVQLCRVLGGGQEAATCTNCGRAYLPSRRPQRGRKNYCRRKECKRAGSRLRKREERARKDHHDGQRA